MQLAGATIANDQDPDRATVIAHVPLETLTTGIGVGETEDGAMFSSDVGAWCVTPASSCWSRTPMASPSATAGRSGPLLRSSGVF